jgi:hypothetical protein
LRLLAQGLWLILAVRSGVPPKNVTVSRPTPPPSGIPVARVFVTGETAEHTNSKQDWSRIEDGFRLKTGDRVRTGPSAVLRIEFPWMAITAAPFSRVSIPAGTVLATVLEEGRVELRGQGSDIIKLRTADAQIRGRGHAIVRRYEGRTLLSVLEGNFSVESGGEALPVVAGEGVRITAGGRPALGPLPAAPRRVTPGLDPTYVVKGKGVPLVWNAAGAAAAYHLQVLATDSDAVLLERDVAASPDTVLLPWLGTYRWRVAQLDASGLEGKPSAEGFVCVVEQ